MDWFRAFYPPPLALPSELDCEELPEREGLVTGVLLGSKGAKSKALKDSYIATTSPCPWPKVFAHRSVLATCSPEVGDLLAFSVHESGEGQPQASAPLWRCLARPPEGESRSSGFPAYIGLVTSLFSSCGQVDSPQLAEAFGKGAFVQKALLAGLAAKDVIAFDVRVNGKGNPQVTAPVYKFYNKHPHSPVLASQKSPKLGPQSPKLGPQSGSPLLPAQRSPKLGPAAPPQEAFFAPRPECTKRLLAKASFVADWAALPPALLPRLLAAAGPEDLFRSGVACRDWQEALQAGERELEGFWRALCTELFPAMAAKLVAEEQERLCLRGQDEEPEPLGDLLPPPALAAASPGGESCPLAGPFWRGKFLQRLQRQRVWDAERLEQQKAKQRRSEMLRQQVLLEDKQRGQNARGQDHEARMKSQRALRSVRQKTCRRCGVSYVPGSTDAAEGCSWHRGKYARVDDDGVLEAGSPAMNKATVQRLIKANAQKKRSRQSAVCLADGNGRPLDERWTWTCCGAENLVAPGCCSGAHT